MLGIESFSRLELEDKIHYLGSVLYPIVKYDENGEKNLEIFLFGSLDKDLVEFYEILLNPEKMRSYVEKKGKEIKDGNVEMKYLENLLNRAKMEMQEKLEGENTDEILEGI